MPRLSGWTSPPCSDEPGGPAAGIITDRPVACGLSRWLRTADGAWIGVVTYVATLTDGTSVKYADQLVPARVLAPR